MKNSIFKNAKIIHEGGNSKVYEWVDKEEYFIIKKYSRVNSNWSERFEREMTALKLLEHNQVQNVPRLIHSDYEERMLITNKLPGVRPNKMTLDIFKRHYEMVNDLKYDKLSIPEKLTIKNASDSLLDPHAFLEKIEKELQYFKNLIDDSRKECNRFYSEAKAIIEKKKKEINQRSKEELRNISDQKVFSFSDLGPRNMLIDGTDIYFMDFEHSGWDDPIKGIIDLIICPSNNTSGKDAEVIIKYILCQGPSWELQRLLNWVEILNIKWVILYTKYAIKVDKNKKITCGEINFVYSKGKKLQRHIEDVINYELR